MTNASIISYALESRSTLTGNMAGIASLIGNDCQVDKCFTTGPLCSNGYNQQTNTEYNLNDSQMQSGEIAWKLNNQSPYGAVWFQNLSGSNIDNYPVLDKQHGRVYYDGSNYTNTGSGPLFDKLTGQGTADKPFLTREDLGIQANGTGIFIVGSHVKKTTEQLDYLLKSTSVNGIELPINDILNHSDALMSRTLETIKALSSNGITPVVYTARKEVRIEDAAQRLRLGQTVSYFLVDIVRRLPIRPSYIVAKGGITSHDILTKGLSVKTARVMGQVINSVPCVMTERFPYIIFPGNVGGPHSLEDIYKVIAL